MKYIRVNEHPGGRMRKEPSSLLQIDHSMPPTGTDTKVDSSNLKTLCGYSTSILCMIHLHNTLTLVIKQFPGSKHCGNYEKKIGLQNQAGCHPKWEWMSAHFSIQTTDALSSSNIMTMSLNSSVRHTTVKKSLFAQKFAAKQNPQKSGQCHKEVEHVWPTWFWDKNIDFKLLSTCKTIWFLHFGPVWDDNFHQWDNSKMTH